jgi:LysM repeat protein
MLPRMTAADAGAPLADESPRPAATATPAGAELGQSPVLRGCPFLLSEVGGWRLDSPSRDHRCAAFSPPAPLAPEKQARLCLTASHVTCATYLASLAAREARLGRAPTDRATRWGLARTTTVIEDPGGIRTRVLGVALDRRRWPAIPAILLVVTLFTLAISGIRGVLPTTGVAATPTAPGPTPLPTTAPPPPTTLPTTFTLPPTGSPEPTLAPTSPPPTPKPKPTYRTYVVRAGDTLSGIASRFHTTVSAIANLNHISDPSKLRVGQVLLIPN